MQNQKPNRALKHIRIYVLQSRPLSVPFTYFLFGILAAVHFNLISDYQSSLLELKLTRFAREWLSVAHLTRYSTKKMSPPPLGREPVKLEKPLDGAEEWISVVM